jgi:hypothetical protein
MNGCGTFTGTIVANDGKIGGWNLVDSVLSSARTKIISKNDEKLAFKSLIPFGGRAIPIRIVSGGLCTGETLFYPHDDYNRLSGGTVWTWTDGYLDYILPKDCEIKVKEIFFEDENGNRESYFEEDFLRVGITTGPWEGRTYFEIQVEIERPENAPYLAAKTVAAIVSQSDHYELSNFLLLDDGSTYLTNAKVGGEGICYKEISYLENDTPTTKSAFQSFNDKDGFVFAVT